MFCVGIRYDWQPLPMCVHSEIMDNWHDPNHNYVGSQVAFKHASDEHD